jgi:hypothetical protein
MAGDEGHLVADEAHAVGDEVGEAGERAGVEDLLAAGHHLGPGGAGPDRGEGGRLHRVDGGEQVLQFGIGLAEHAHAADVADPAVEIAAGIERDRVARAQGCVGGGAVRVGSEGDEAVVEFEAAVRLLAAQGLGEGVLGDAGVGRAQGRRHGLGDQLGGAAQAGELGRGLDRAQVLQHAGRVGQPIRAAGRGEHRMGVGGQEGGFDADAPGGGDAVEMRDRASGGSGGGVGDGLEGRRPEGRERVVPVLHRAADIGRAVRRAAEVDHHRQVAAVADRLHRREEERPAAAHQVAGVVPRGGDQDVEPCRRHQPVEKHGVEGRSDFRHGLPRFGPVVAPPCRLHRAGPRGAAR